jgi:hypothetical protein
MATINVLIEGQTLTMPAGIEKDEDIRRALAPYFPEVSTALLTRKEEGEVVTISIVKKAGSKGIDPWSKGGDQGQNGRSPLQKIVACPGGMNPAIALHQKIDQLGADVDIVDLLVFESEIDQALREGEKQRQAVVAAHERLLAAVAQPALVVVLGF